ncbi:hypothetical protein AB0B94_30760 [Micromonospora sp. NPDC048986]|uniref:hypothetical protein n=1 Tax=Micromonospora sp. NPDC048986 TaxID=3155644 RepID=UPI0033E2D592
MTWTSTTYGAEFGADEQANGIRGFLNGGEYTPATEDAIYEALMVEYNNEVNDLLPEGATWEPATSQFTHPRGAEMPDHEEMTELFRVAWSRVESRYETIEAAALA